MASAQDDIPLTLAETRQFVRDIRPEESFAPAPLIGANAADRGQGIEQAHYDDDALAAQLAVAQATARAIAHALNQPLAVIRGLTELLQTAPPGESSASDLAQILIATDRAAAIVRDLVRLARYTTQLAADGYPMLDMRTAIDPPAQLE